MNYAEMLKKTTLQITGICKGVNEYVSKNNGNVYYSVDIEVQGVKNPINVKLESTFNRAALNLYEIVTLQLMVVPTFDKKNIELRAI